MAATCVVQPASDARESVYCRQKIPKLTTGWAEKVHFCRASEVRTAQTYAGGASPTYRRYLVHTANSFPPTKPTPTSRNTNTSTDICQRVSVLVTQLLQSIAQCPSAYGTLPPGYDDDDLLPAYDEDHDLARACITPDSTAPTASARRSRQSPSRLQSTMDFNVDFGSTSGVKSYAKKKKAAPAAKFDPWGGDDNGEKKDDTGASGTGGGDDAAGGAGGDAGAGGGGDDNNGGGNDDDDAWGFSTGKKSKKKSKKKQDEEEEEEQKRKEDEEAAAAAGNPDPLSWADDANNGDAANEDWTMSWGGTGVKKKDKKKKDAPPAVPDAPPATSAFQDISLDDGAPKLDFSFDGLDDSKKNEGGGGFSNWGKSWDFGGVGKTEEKKEEPSDFGNNNPWGFGGAKTKKKSTMSNFDFGDFGTGDNNDNNDDNDNELSFENNGDDVTDTKPADDAWGFGAVGGKKDKKKKGAIEEIKEQPAAEPQEETWGTWGAGAKKTTKSKKSSAFDVIGETNDENAADPSFSWGFGTKDKKKDLVSEVEEKPKDEEGDDWMSGAWGTGAKKKTKKKDDLSASIDLNSNADAKTVTSEPADDGWGAFSTGGKKKKGKKDLLDDEPPPNPEAPEPPTFEPEAPKEPLVAWDFGLSAKDKKKKQKQMQLEGSWDERVTQEMVDAAEADAAAFQEVVAAEPTPEPIPPPPAVIEIRTAWDEGLTAVKKRKKMKEMQLDGSWDSRVTQEMVDEDRAAAEAAAAQVVVVPENELDPEPVPPPEAIYEVDSTPLEDLTPWDYLLTTKEKKKKEKEMKADGSWDDRLTQEKIDQMIADRDAGPPADVEVLQEPEPEPIPEPAEPEIPPEDLLPWDHMLSTKEKKKREKEMRADGSWDNRLTQIQIDEKIAAAAAANEPEPIPEPEAEPEPMLEFESAAPVETVEEAESLTPWDLGLNPKDKKKRERQMKLDFSWEDRLTQDMIDERIAAARAAAASADPEPIPEPEPEPEPAAIFEERFAWDYGLSVKDKKKRERQMKLDGSWDGRLTQEQIDDDAAAAAAPPEPEPEPIQEESIPEPEPEAEPRFAWDHGLSAKDKKKKEKQMKLDGAWVGRLTQEQIDDDEAAKAAAAAGPEPEPLLETAGEGAAENGWGFGWGGDKPKTKNKSLLDPEPQKTEEKAEAGWGGSWGFGGKKKKGTTPVAEEPGPVPEPEPEPVKEEKVEDTRSLGPTTKDKKKKVTKKSAFDTLDDFPPPVPTPPAMGLTPEPEAEPAAIPSVDNFDWSGLGSGKKAVKTPVDEAPAKKSSSSMWGFGSSSSAAKTKKEKEKEANAKKEAEEQAQKEEERQQQEADEADRLAAEEATKSTKKSKVGKLTKSSSKTEEKKKSDDLLDLLDEPAPTPASSSSKLKKTSTRGSDKKLEDVPEDDAKPASDYFGFWGGSSKEKKTAGKKSMDDKKEITSPVLTNDEDALLAELNEDEIQAILDDTPAPPSSKTTKTMSNGKSKVNSSIADRIKALEGKKEEVGKKLKSASAALIVEETEPEIALTPKEEKKAAKSKSAKSSKSKVDQPLSPPPEADGKKSKDSIPGGFPGAFGDDDDLLADEPLPLPEPEEKPKLKKSSSKVEKKPIKPSSSKKKSLAFEDPIQRVAEPADDLDLLGEPAKLPTPPPDEKKKERPRVERSATSSWGFWGASAPTPKKPSRSRTLDDVSPPSTKKAKSPPAVTRSASKRKSKRAEAEDVKDGEKASKTSGSDKEGSAQRTDRPKASRGMSFAGFMLGTAPPSAMRNPAPLKRSSTTGSRSSSRRHSTVDSGLLSPPPDDDDPITAKAAKLMGIGGGKPSRGSSTKEKSRSYPDPYPIDDDDMVMIHATDKDEPSSKKPKNKIVTSVKKSSTKPRSKTISGDEDVVMVDSPLGMDSGHEDFERPQLQRSNTGRKSFFGGLFGAKTSGGQPRSAQVTDTEDNGLPTRSRGQSRRRSRVTSPVDGFTTDAPGETDADYAAKKADRRAKRAAAAKAEEDDRVAREERRRERRDREKADLEARRERARDQARKERETDEQRREERRARRREKEAAERARLAEEEAELEAAAEARREERRRLREQLEADAGIKTLSKDDRRRTYAGEEDPRKRHRDGKHRSKKEGGRRSTALMAEYHESRSGSGRGIKPPENKTSSWIDSQKDEPPEMPPLAQTVLDESGQVPRPVDDAERRRRKDKYAGMNEDDIAAARAQRRERRVTEKSSSGNSDEKMQRKASKRASRNVEDDFYGNGFAEPIRPQQAKRSSFLGKFF